MTVDLGENNPGIHWVYGDHLVKIEPAFEDYAFMLEDVCAAMKLSSDECMIFPMMGPIKNAVATIYDGNRIIVYDRRLSAIIGGDGAEVVIAHELAHHYCGHLYKASDPKQELEADRFAGAAMKLMGRPLDAAMSAIPILAERPARTHPGRAERIEALVEGWEHPERGKACND
jgi:hypothetical protein